MRNFIFIISFLFLVSCIKTDIRGFTRWMPDYEEIMALEPDSLEYAQSHTKAQSGFKYDINKGNTFKNGEYVFIFSFPGSVDRTKMGFFKIFKPFNNDIYVISNRFLELHVISKNCSITPLEVAKIELIIYDKHDEIISKYTANNININDETDLIDKYGWTNSKLWRNGYCSMGFLDLFEKQVDLSEVNSKCSAKVLVWVESQDAPTVYTFKAYHMKWGLLAD